ncbi:alpha/beta hydrolase [Sinorhizobium numidicum]|uniref:Alpha/beta hydrolase n=1 Tax=Sinorhizobium numidicum TaxID=680248 RepID=A0ABY8CPV6_9HYPH|nr:alpha/beta hydrolase [Sinorhizobium numidicum]WEX74678.1 alpha/beta hydrolase [Sinorhizobium numidicum]WEX80670.1 alpha/beta hydrolase [Sinorhizobium numidicum]
MSFDASNLRLRMFATLFFLLPCILVPAACSSGRGLVGELPAGTETAASHIKQDNSLDLLYVTDRVPAASANGELAYSSFRGRSMSFGSVTLARDRSRFDDGSAGQPDASLQVSRTTKLGEFPQSPYPIELTPQGPRRVPETVDAHMRAAAGLQAEVTRRLAMAERKEVVIFVHGYNNSFDDAAKATGKICNALSAEFVCVSLSWPAGGSGGAFYGYNIDRESGEFAVADVKKAIRIISATEAIKRLHLIAHSRGADVLLSALQQLGMEAYTTRSSPTERYKISNVVLFAPDIDLDVATARLFGFVSDPDAPFGANATPYGLLPPIGSLHLTVYSSPNDQALALSSGLFGSVVRLGRLTSASISSKEAGSNALWKNSQLSGIADFIEYKGRAGFAGHSYFLSDPAVQKDLVALLRDRLKAGGPGRPLVEIKRPFWSVLSRNSKLSH